LVIVFVSAYRQFVRNSGYMQAIFSYDFDGIIERYRNDKKKLKVGSKLYF